MLAFNFFKPSWALLCTLHVCMSLLLADAVHQNPQPILLLSRTIQSVSRTLFASGLFNTIWMLPNSMQAAVPSQSHSSPAGPEKVVRVVNQPGCQYKIEFRPNTSAVEEVPPVYPMCVRPRGPIRTTLLQIYFQLWALYKDVLNWICDVKCQRPKKDEKEVSNRPNALGQLEATNMSQNCQFEGRLRMEKSLQEADSGKSRLMLVIQLSNQPGNIVHVPLVLGFPHLGYLVEQNAQVTGVQSTSVNITCHKQAD
ncbi:unnamed protein product [Protopolystoma xenopodis]|uniref:Uncharacterized protein n=1 Tax=Protopolystoma xenopodis TaxID=117903 RepID=A0A3S5B323_9PLAT|nr:unnamed protein product [Protopolystoma xenopodis]